MALLMHRIYQIALSCTYLRECHAAGAKTGRCPKDKRVVREPDSQDDIWWSDGSNGSPNYEMDDRTFKLNRERAVDYLNMLDRLYVFDGFAGWEPEVSHRACCP